MTKNELAEQVAERTGLAASQADQEIKSHTAALAAAGPINKHEHLRSPAVGPPEIEFRGVGIGVCSEFRLY